MSTLNKKSPIAFFDSGVGGLTVLDKVKKLLPDEQFIFYGDSAHVPYGDKTKEQLLEYARPILDFFENKGCKAVVMACNTTSSVIYDSIKNDYSFELYPIVQSVAKILSNLEIDKLGVFATKATIESGAYQREISKYNKSMKVFGQYCPHWVNIVENNLIYTQKSEDIIKNDLDIMLKNSPQKIVLGCTHYPYLTKVLSKFAPEEIFIDPASDFANYIKEDLKSKNLLSDNYSGNEEYYVSSDPEKFMKASEIFYKISSEPILKIL